MNSYKSDCVFILLIFSLKEYVVLGQVDIEDLVENNLRDVSDWEKNFRALKLRGRDAEKLPK